MSFLIILRKREQSSSWLDINMDWNIVRQTEQAKDYYRILMERVDEAYAKEQVFPQKDLIFNALDKTSFDDVKVVILGQDPYHDDGQAMGLSFSVNKDIKIPPSLKNIYKELNLELGLDIPDNGDLSAWAEQGVLLLNSVLTVRAHEPGSHQKFGWQQFTDAIIASLNSKETPVVFMLWGNYARTKKDLITNTNHLILEAAHPSPLSFSKGFKGCGHFKKCNEFLESKGMEPVNWQIENAYQQLSFNM